MITPEYSTDDGKTFLAANSPAMFTPPLAKTLYVGLEVSSADRLSTVSIQFRDLAIQKL